MNTVHIDICICTFRRPYLADTLRSLTRLNFAPDWKLRIIVADNDETPSARALVEKTVGETGLAVTYLHAPARNISVARNACLDAATAPFVAFIDDDEQVTPAWLAAMLSTMETTGADVVLGPVRAIYGQDCPGWIRRADFHSTIPSQAGAGKMVVGCSTGNALLRRSSPVVHDRRFRMELGRSGGEDTVYFSEVYKAGGIIAISPEAWITEIVTPNRACFDWLLKRRFRSGQTHGLILLEATARDLSGRLKELFIALAKAAFCCGGVAANIARADPRRFWALRGAFHTGVVCRLLGKRELEQYG